MVILGRAIRTGGILLTAIMTLVAGAPHLVCRCPNGRIKPSCLSVFTAKSTCCERSCCSPLPAEANASPPAAAVKQTCCCCETNQEKPSGEHQSVPRLERAACQKALAEAAAAVFESPVKVSVLDLTGHLLGLAPEPIRSQQGFGVCTCWFGDRYHWPPPSDLVTVLQRFLI